MSPYNLDSPLSDAIDDQFTRLPFAKRIADTIKVLKTEDPLVIAVYGKWGEGKTTVLNFISQEFDKTKDEVVYVKFNPWRFPSESILLRSFFDTLADKLGHSILSNKEKLGEFCKKYGLLLTPLSVGIWGVQASPGEAVAKLGESLSSSGLDDFKQKISAILKEEKKRIVVIMDDIDRLDKEEIQAVFKLVKLTADFPYLVYILAFDEDVVVSALKEKYSTSSEEFGHNFLEKIVQVPLNLPPANKIALREYCFKRVDNALKTSGIELSEEEAQKFGRHFVDGLELRLKTPRKAKLYANILTFTLPILRGEVNPVDQMLVEGIRIFYPRVYKFIISRPDIFLGEGFSGYGGITDEQKQKLIADINGSTADLSIIEKESVKGLLQALFPRLKSIYANYHFGQDSENRWMKEKKVCSSKYFPRYFSLGVPGTDISDHRILELLKIVSDGTISDRVQAFQSMVTNQNAAEVITHLRLLEDELTADQAKNFIELIYTVPSLFPDRRGAFLVSPFSQAAIFIWQILKRIPEGVERFETAKKVLLDCSSLIFSSECFVWFHNRKKEDEEEGLFTESENIELRKALADRIKSDSKKEIIFLQNFLYASRFLYIWKDAFGQKEVGDYIAGCLSQNSQNVAGFLKCFLTRAWGMESGLPVPGRLEREGYDSISRFIDPEVIFNHLRELFDFSVIDTATYPRADIESDELIAKQFAYYYAVVKGGVEQPKEVVMEE